MDNNDIDFDGWFEMLRDNLADKGISFHDRDSVEPDYLTGEDLFDVMDAIIADREI